MRRKLQVRHGVHRHAVDADLEVEMRARAVTGTADVANDLTPEDVLAFDDHDAALVAVEGGEGAAVVDDRGVAVAAARSGGHDVAVGRSLDRRAGRGPEVDSRVHAD